jgi:PhzF family phenazine biosynthesis protein
MSADVTGAVAMSRRTRVFRVDAFCTQPFAGNPAAVVPDAGALSDAQMLSLTRELGGVDVAFVLPPEAGDHDLRLRFFTPRAETGFVGHATIAAHAVLEALGLPPCPRQLQRGGVVEIERLGGGAGRQYAFSQPPPPATAALGADRLAPMLAALGLAADELDPQLPPVLAGSGASRALIAVRSGATLARLQPDDAALVALTAAGNPSGYFLYTLAPARSDCDTEARMFCPAIGIREDPVSGNAHALLAAHLHAVAKMPGAPGAVEFTGRQGHHLGRPGVLTVRIETTGGVLRRVRVAGAAVIVMAAHIELP